jgi:hypothetical protein
MKYLYMLLFAILTVYGCGKGIEPEPEREAEGFGGKILFSGAWPDSVTRTHLVVFKDPLLTEGDFNIFNLAFVSMEIPYSVNEHNYSSLDSALFPINNKIQDGTYRYVAVAQQKTPELTLNRSDWFVVGVFYSTGDTLNPGTLVIRPDQFTDGINIICDFSNPPPQPPGGRNVY